MLTWTAAASYEGICVWYVMFISLCDGQIKISLWGIYGYIFICWRKKRGE